MTHAPSQRFGLIVTVAGALMFVPDALVIRLSGGPVMDIALWRGLFAATTTTLGLLLFGRHILPSWAQLRSFPTLAFIVMHGTGTLLFLGAIGHTSVANTLLISAIAPFLAAAMSFVFLGERISRPTFYGIIAVFAGVLVIASGSIGGGGLIGDLLALANATMTAAYYTLLRRSPDRNMIAPSVLGYLLTIAIALPLAPLMVPTMWQLSLYALSGGVILAGGCALLIIGPRHLPAPEVAMITMVEVVATPLLVWLAIGENPGQRSIIGGAVILTALVTHTLWRLRAPTTATA